MGKSPRKKPPAFRRILKLTPGRDERRLKLIWKGHVELHQGRGYLPDYEQMARWGWLEKHEPVDWLDDYSGYRPTALGLEYPIHDEKYHLILVKKKHVEAASARAMDLSEIKMMAALATWALMATTPSEHHRAHTVPPSRRSVRRYERQGYMTLDDFFLRNHGLGWEQLVVCGIIRYPEFPEEEELTGMDVWPKARHCLRSSKSGQTYMVRPGMEKALVELCKVEVHFIS